MPLDLVKIIFIPVAGAINIFLGVLVLLRNPKNIVNRIFFCISFLLGLWSFCLLFYEFPPVLSRVFWIKATYLIISVQEVLVLAFSYVFPKPIFTKAWIWILGILYSVFFLGLTIYLLFFTNEWIKGVEQDPLTGVQTVLGGGYIWWSFAIWGTLIIAIGNFIYHMRHTSGKNKVQLAYLLNGFFFFGVIATVADIVIPFLYQDTSLFSISAVASLAFTFAAAYVIVRHRFLDIRLVVARSVAYVFLVLILGMFYISGLFLISTIFMNQETDTNNLVTSTFLALFMALSFQPLKRFLEKITDDIFYQEHYDPDALLSNVGLIMSTNIELKPLAVQIIKTLLGEMRITKGAFVILGEGQTSIYDIIDMGFSQKFAILFEAIQVFSSYQQIIVFDELEENQLKSLMRQMDISVVKSLNVKNEIVGFLILGTKASGEIFSAQDLKILEMLAPEMAVAIQNSKSYDKIKKFNIILQQEITRATVDLQQANSRLTQLDQLKDDFVSIASHELRTPMTAIRSYAWMALHRSDVPLSATLEKYIARILLSTERLINLVNDMLNVSRIESNKVEINPESVDVLSLVRDIIDEVYYSKSEEGNIQFIVPNKVVPKIIADPEKLRQVFLNLVGNSLKFTPAGGKITFDFFSDGKVVETSVTDTGIGIPKEDMSKLFHKFSRLDNSYTATATSGGTGLGLYISKKLVEMMHGKIWVVSKGLNQGTTVTVALPVASQEVLQNSEKYASQSNGEARTLEPVSI